MNQSNASALQVTWPLLFSADWLIRGKTDGTEQQSIPICVSKTFAQRLKRPSPLDFGSVSIQTRRIKVTCCHIALATKLGFVRSLINLVVISLRWVSLRILWNPSNLLGRLQTTVNRNSRMNLENGLFHRPSPATAKVTWSSLYIFIRKAMSSLETTK